jgi:hypothetical protein
MRGIIRFRGQFFDSSNAFETGRDTLVPKEGHATTWNALANSAGGHPFLGGAEHLPCQP